MCGLVVVLALLGCFRGEPSEPTEMGPESTAETGLPSDSTPPPEETGQPEETAETEETGGDTEPATPLFVSASCAPTANELIVVCEAVTAEPAVVSFEVAEQGGGEVRALGSSEGKVHTRTVWGLAAGATYEFMFRGEGPSGLEDAGPKVLSIETPEAFRTWDATLAVADPGHQTRFVLTNADLRDHGTLVIVDDLARPVWYVDITAFARNVSGLSFTEEGTVLAIFDDRLLMEFALDGTVLREWSSDLLGTYVHHEVFRHDGLIWALVVEQLASGGRNYAVDGLWAFDDSGVPVEKWSMSEVYPLEETPWYSGLGYWSEEYPTAYDPFTVNSLQVGPDGDWYVSRRVDNEIIRVETDPASPNVGQAVWTLRGDGEGTLDEGAYIGVTPRFSGQHQVTRVDDGSVWMLDNNGSFAGSRGLQIAVSEATNTAQAVADYPLGEVCPVTGGIGFVGENVLVTCGTSYRFVEFAPEGEILWDFSFVGSVVPSFRGIPVSLW
jgi:hypothetical protein